VQQLASWEACTFGDNRYSGKLRAVSILRRLGIQPTLYG
jgi:hypothetical protein